MKNFLKFLAFMFISGIVLNSCTDEFTEEDAMEALQLISLQIAVHDASNSDAALGGVQIKAIIDTSAVTATTNSNGIAVFENIRIGGNINIYVSKDGYTTVFTTVGTTPNDYRQTVVSGNVYLYSTTGSNVATINGQLTIETNLINREREYVSDVLVLAYNSSLGGTDKFFTDTTDASGNYSIIVPIDGDGGNYIYVYFPTIERDRTAGRNINNVYSIETKTATYSASNYAETAVDQVPSAVMTIAAPSSAGSGFQLGLEVVPENVTSQIGTAYIINGGSGYGTGAASENIDYNFSAGEGGSNSQITLNVQNGVINSVVGYINNDVYTSKPSITLTGGSGAVIDFRYYLRYRVYVDNGGSGYITYPDVGAEYYYYSNDLKLEKEVDADITTSSEISGPELFTNTIINGGVIMSNSGNGDTLFTTSYLAAPNEPTFIYYSNTPVNASYYLSAGQIDSDSTLSGGYNTINSGSGYDPENPPAVTVSALVSGFGSGASWLAEVNSSGSISALVMIEEGAGFVDDVNDYDQDGNFSEEEDADLTGFSTWSTGYGRHDNVKPGMTYTGDVFYGTGTVKNE